MLRARAETSRGVGPAAHAELVGPRCRRCTGYWLPRFSGRQRLGAVFHASSAVRRVSSPSKIPPLQGWTLSTRPVRLRAGREIALRHRRCVRLPLLGFQRRPSVGINALRPVPVAVVLRRCPPSAREEPSPPAPSARAVSLGFDGLLRCVPRRLRAPGVRAQLALNPLPKAFLLQPTVGFMPFRRLLRVRALSIRPCAFRRQNRKNREVRAAFQVRPRSCPTLRSVSLVSSRPIVTDGRFPLAGSGRCGWPETQLRAVFSDSAGVLPAPRPCSAAESVGRVAVASGSAPMLPWALS